jgi:ubiquinone/menaquinone biosynthesis C-methylase UbiE
MTGTSGPTAARYDEGFADNARSQGMRRVWEVVDPDLPAEVEPFSFVSADLLARVATELRLGTGQVLVDLACGRGGPGMHLARTIGASLIGIDFSRVAIEHARRRAADFGLADRARFVVGDLTATGLEDAVADAVVCIDAMHFASDIGAAAREASRVLRPGGRLVLTNWQPRTLHDDRLPQRIRGRDWAATLRDAGFGDVAVTSPQEWHELYTRVYETALALGDPGADTGLAEFQGEARQMLPTADLVDRVLVTATAPDSR